MFRRYSHLCFERQYPRQNSVIRLKWNILPPPKFLGWLRYWTGIGKERRNYSAQQWLFFFCTVAVLANNENAGFQEKVLLVVCSPGVIMSIKYVLLVNERVMNLKHSTSCFSIAEVLACLVQRYCNDFLPNVLLIFIHFPIRVAYNIKFNERLIP